MSEIDHPIPWTRLQGTDIFQRAMDVQGRNPRRIYHDARHPVVLYGHARDTFGFSYDRALDLAILTHDVIFDSMNDREMRSIEWLANALPDGEQDPDFEAAAAHIERTIAHRIDADPRMVMLDLADFIDPDRTRENAELLRKEARALHGVEDAVFEVSCADYLGGLLERFRPGRETLPEGLRRHHEAICRGIAENRNRFITDTMAQEAAHG